MNKGHLKNIIIIALGILTVYQTIGLWFGSFSDRNLFYTILNKQNTQLAITAEYNLVEARKVIVGFGNKSFNIIDLNVKENKTLDESAAECIKYLTQNGNYVSTSKIDWNELLLYKLVMYEYKVEIPMNYYIKSAANKNVSSFSNRQEYFDTVIIVPSRSTGEQMKVYFINSLQDKCVLFSCRKSSVNDTLYSEIDKIQNTGSNINYISTEQSKLNIFNKNIFLPELSEKSVRYAQLSIKNPYSTNYKISMQSVETYIDGFFDNPMAKWSSVDLKGVYIYNDESVVVRYYPYSLLEYFDYRASVSKTNTLESAFAAVQQFLYRDITLPEEIRISSIRQENDTWIIGFDRYVNGFPIEVSEELLNKLGIKNEIEISVKNSKVISYKRYVYDLDVKYINKNFSSEVSFVQGLNGVVKRLEKENISVDNMYLSYTVSSEGISDIMWTVIIDNKKYTQTLEVSDKS